MLASFNRLFSLALGVIAVSFIAATAAAPSGQAAARKQLGSCPLQGDGSGIVTAVDERLDIVLADGRMLHLAGVDPPRPTPDRPEGDLQARDWLAGKVRGRTVNFVALALKSDRWGRIPAVIFDEALDSEHPSLAASLFAAGLARVRPQTEIRACLRGWLADEAMARAAKLGLWGDPYYAILTTDEGSAFAEKAATDIIVEGRLADAITSRTGLRLEFGPRQGRSFSAVILQRNVRNFEQAGMKFGSLIGRDLRIRGLLDMRFGPQIEIASPDAIELIAEERVKVEPEIETNASGAPPSDLRKVP